MGTCVGAPWAGRVAVACIPDLFADSHDASNRPQVDLRRRRFGRSWHFLDPTYHPDRGVAAMLSQLWSSITSGGPIVIMTAAALAVLLFFWGLSSALSRSFDPARRRLDEIAADSGAAPSASLGNRIADVMRPVERF